MARPGIEEEEDNQGPRAIAKAGTLAIGKAFGHDAGRLESGWKRTKAVGTMS